MVAGIASFNVAIDNSGSLTTHFSRPLDSISRRLFIASQVGCYSLAAAEFRAFGKTQNPPMRTKRNHPDTLTRQLRGCQVSHVSVPDEQHLLVHFSNGLVLAIERGSQAITASVESSCWSTGRNAEHAHPTQRQLEYLRFITRYIGRFGRAPAESDIERHFLVSAPSVNQMMQTLERLGFISRQRGIPRSIRVNITLPDNIEESVSPSRIR